MIKIKAVESKPMKVSIRHNDVTNIKISSTIVEVIDGVERYEGEYRVIPKAHTEQTLLTRNKYLSDDVKVSQVPYFEVSNTKGQTVFIASEV